MITYKDQAWCMSSRECANEKCSRNYTDAERKRNRHRLPLSIVEYRKDGCGFVERKSD